jgi:hypothetical protein
MKRKAKNKIKLLVIGTVSNCHKKGWKEKQQIFQPLLAIVMENSI